MFQIHSKKHIVENHPTNLKCKLCEQIFTKSNDIERQIKSSHGKSEKYECDQCEKTFVLKLRLNKNVAMHTASGTKGCSFWNNNKFCPYELGCMFAHKKSGMCKYGINIWNS